MTTAVRMTEDPERVLTDAAGFLAGDPIRHNVVLSLLHLRVADPEPGRYWIVDVDGDPAGVVFQSPLHFSATITPMSADAATAAADAIAGQGVSLPGVNGEAATVSRFAGRWTERTRSAARPILAERIYEVERVIPARPAGGSLRRAAPEEKHLLAAWIEAFSEEIGEPPPNDPAAVIERGLRAGQLWLWDRGGPVALAGLTDPVATVVRVGPVYTPPERRGSGYASALVAATSSAALADGHRCILYTDLANPVSNSIYRALGYRAVAEGLRYRFDPPR